MIDEMVTFEKSLCGKRLVQVDVTRDPDNGDVIRFYTKEGKIYEQFHKQICCELVTIEDINGNFHDLLDQCLLIAEERSSQHDWHSDAKTATWTFYVLRTHKGSVDIRWLGTSNGAYSEAVNFRELGESEVEEMRVAKKTMCAHRNAYV